MHTINAVVDAFASDIRARRLPSGTRLPTHRQLAAREGIAVVTASRAYAELEAMGLVSGEQGRGTFVRDIALPPGHGIDQRAAAADTVDLSFNYPALPGQAGDVVAVDALTYPGFKVLARTLRLELAPLPATQGGTDLDALEQLCAARPVRAVYVMPTLHNPLGWVMDAPARARLVEIARRHGLLIIEDASYAYLADNAPPPACASASSRPRPLWCRPSSERSA